jgi:hypothetical protein
MNFFEFSLSSVLALSCAVAQANPQIGSPTSISGADRPDQFPIDELAIAMLSSASIKERETPGAGIAYLREAFGISSIGAERILAVLDSQSARAPDPKARVKEYCTALKSVSSRADTLRIMRAFYAEDMDTERAKGAELLASLDLVDREKLIKVLQEEVRPSTTKSELNFELLLEQTPPEEYKKSVCEVAK